MRKVYKEGDIMNNLIYLREAEPKGKRRQAEFKCYCGNIFIAVIKQVRGGNTSSCGCLGARNKPKYHISKNVTQIPEYYPYKAMKYRCYNPSLPSYHRYGGRGITVCDRWLDEKQGFLNFLEDMAPRPSLNHTLDRIENDKGYYKENCRWATKSEQNRNRRDTVYLEYQGKRLNLYDWEKETGIPVKILKSRREKGLSPERIFNPIIRIHRKK